MARGRRETRRGGSFGQRKMKMKLDAETEARLKSEGLHFRWVNDDPGRLDEAYKGDYDFLTADGTEVIGEAGDTTEKGRKMRKLVGTHKDGKPKYAYGMVIKQKFYEENKEKKESVNKMVDTAINGGDTGEGQLGSDPNNPNKQGLYKKNINYNP